MNRPSRTDRKAIDRSHATQRARRFAAGVEMLEPRAVLSGMSPVILPPPSIDGPAIVAPPAAVATGLGIRLPSAVANGVPTPVTVLATDAAGRPVFGFTGTANLTSSDAAATLPATVKLVDGRATVMITFRTAGSQTVSATDATVPSLTATASTTVAQPRVAMRLSMLVPPQARAGVATPVVAIAVDAAGRPVPTFNGSATVASSDTGAGLPLVPVVFKDGRATFPVTFATAGRQTVTVTSLGDPAITGTASTVVTAPQALASFAVMMPPRATTGTAVSVTILAMDAGRRPIPGYTGTATLASSDAAATLPEKITFSDGRAVARVTFATVGSQTVTVRGGAAGDIVSTASTQVVAAPVATRFAVLMPRAAASGVPVAVVLVAVDAQGRPVVGFTGTATLSSGDPAATVPATVTFVKGRAITRVTFGTVGEQTLTATADTISGSGKIQVGEVAIMPVV